MSTETGFKKAVKYLRELSIVVVGIAITLAGNDWLSNRTEKKELQEYLDAVKFELEDGLEGLNKLFEFYDKTAKFAEYLLSDEPENLHPDSLDQHIEIIGQIPSMSFNAPSFEMLKMSGTMRLIKDKELLESILNSYTLLGLLKQSSDRYRDRKLDEVYKFVLDNNSFDLYNITAPENRRLYYFFASPIDIERIVLECSQQIEKTLSLF